MNCRLIDRQIKKTTTTEGKGNQGILEAASLLGNNANNYPDNDQGSAHSGAHPAGRPVLHRILFMSVLLHNLRCVCRCV